jgi:hypothetical protein
MQSTVKNAFADKCEFTIIYILNASFTTYSSPNSSNGSMFQLQESWMNGQVAGGIPKVGL